MTIKHFPGKIILTTLISLFLLLLSWNINASAIQNAKKNGSEARAQKVDIIVKSKIFFPKREILEALSVNDKKIRLIVRTKPSVSSKDLNTKSPQNRKWLKQNTSDVFNRVANRLGPSTVKIRKNYSYIHAFSAEADLEGIEKLISDEDVIGVFEDVKRFPMVSQGLSLIQGIGSRNTYGGNGVSIAILDTGIDYNHPMLGGGGFPNSKVIGGTDTGEDDNDPFDADGHGTAVAGIAAGQLPPAQIGDYIGGIAPEAKLYALKITASDGWAYDSDIIEAMEWCITNQYYDPDNPIKIINISFGSGKYSGHCDTYDSYAKIGAQVVENAIQAGISIFASSGNEGYTNATVLPACYSEVISVGEVYDANIGLSGPYSIGTNGYEECTDDTTHQDLVTCYSNSSKTLDVLAPGNDAFVPDIIGSQGYDHGDYFPDFGGTSAASPYAAGAAALVQSASINNLGFYFTPSELRDLFVTHGDPVTDPRNKIVKPRINISKVLQRVIVSGDINNDSQADNIDTIISLSLITKRATSGIISTSRDFNNDNRIGLEDAIYTMRVSAGICSLMNTISCITEQACTDVQGFWYESKCNQKVCSEQRLDLCPDQEACTEVNGVWYESQCN